MEQPYHTISVFFVKVENGDENGDYTAFLSEHKAKEKETEFKKECVKAEVKRMREAGENPIGIAEVAFGHDELKYTKKKLSEIMTLTQGKLYHAVLRLAQLNFKEQLNMEMTPIENISWLKVPNDAEEN